MQRTDQAAGDLDRLTDRLDAAIAQLAEAPSFAKVSRVRPVLDSARRVLLQPDGAAAVQSRAGELDASGVFAGTDWAVPELLNPALSPAALTSTDADTVLIESLSLLRLLAVARGEVTHATVTDEHAEHHLVQVLALNMALLFGTSGEAEREQPERLTRIARATVQHVADTLGHHRVLPQLVDEIWRIIGQRPIMVEVITSMITQIAVFRRDPTVDLGPGGHGADRLISSLYGPTRGCREDPGIEVYRDRLTSMDRTTLQAEASGFARAMHDTGLVSAYHTVLLQHLRDHDDHLLGEALGLGSTGRDCLSRFRPLVDRLIEEAIAPATSQAAYGLSLLLERGILHQSPIGPALWRQVQLPLAPGAEQRLRAAFGDAVSPRARLLSGVLSMLGQPLGVGQGDNPTCQSARALSMWASNDPDYLMQMVVWAARDEEVVMHFEGQPISSAETEAGVAVADPIDLDPVSLVVVPHLDRIYAEMGRRCIGREGDPHRWVNPEFHGWWSWRGFRINVDVATGQLVDLEGFLRDFYATYHPLHNGHQPLIHPQPAGIAATDTGGRFVGWHAITVLRVDTDPQGVVRMYFFNPNNDGGQDWGDGVRVSTAGHGEHHGESSLPFDQFASRLYIFHVDPLEAGEPASVDREELDRVVAMVHRTWGADRHHVTDLQADAGP